SQRVEIYRQYAHRLIQSGRAYFCYCSPERLENLKRLQQEQKKDFGYDRRCRNLTEEEKERFKQAGIKPVIRLKIPLEGSTILRDELLGAVERKNEDVNPDPVLLKSDGFPTYHLANVIDDHLMEITHIMRAQEWISSGPLHVILYTSFGWEPPKYCHLPMVLGTDGHKLSKRHGATSIKEFRTAGYLPEALINYISLIGWSYDDSKEFFTVQELTTLFTLEKLNKAPGVFDYKKLDWFNGQYIRMKDNKALLDALIPFLIKDGIVHSPLTEEEERLLQGALPLVKERLKTLSEVSELAGFLFKDIDEYRLEDVIPKKLEAASTLKTLKAVREALDGFETRTDEENETVMRRTAEELGIKLGEMLMPLRVALTGSRVSLPLFESLRVLGLDKAFERIDRVIELLRNEVE
ncbi:MAG: glutamate--tRNA ligase, partial [Spirochaetota bacterium]